MKNKIIISASFLSILLIGTAFMLRKNNSEKPAPNAKVNWVSIEEAQELNKKEPRKILIDMYTNWCGPCKMMTQNTFTNPVIVKHINENYYAVKFNAQGNSTVKFKGKTFTNPNFDKTKSPMARNAQHQFANAMTIRSYPTIIYLDEKLEVLQPIPGYYKPAQIEPILHYFSSNSYKSVPWESYQKNFKSEL